MNEFILTADTKMIVQTHTPSSISAQRRLIKADKTERCTTALKAGLQGDRHFRNRTFCNGVGARTTGLQTHS